MLLILGITYILHLGLSFQDDDISEFITLMTTDECIKHGQKILQAEPNARIQVAGSKEAEDKMFEGTNRTGGGMHILCAGHSMPDKLGTTSMIPTEIIGHMCYVMYNETLENYLAMDRDLNNPSEQTQTLLKEIYTSSCTFKQKSDKVVSVKLVEKEHQCYFDKLSKDMSPILYSKMKDLAAYIAIVLGGLGILGNGIGLSVHFSTGCDKKQSVYFVTKGFSDSLLLACTIIQGSLTLETDPNLIIADYWHPILYQFSLFSRNWITVVIGLEKVLAVWAPFFARAHFGRGLEIKLSLITVGIASVFTAGDFLTRHFISYLARVIDIKYLLIGGEIKMPIYSVVIFSLLPWVIVVVCSVITVVGIKSSRKKRARLTNQEGNDQVDNNTHDNGDLILCLLAFIISNVPVVIYAVLLTIGNTLENAILVILRGKTTVIMGMVYLFFNLIGYSMDFYVSLAAREGFREQLKANMLSIKNRFLRKTNNFEL